MKDMKKRIVALILVAVMSVLSLASCSAAFDFAEEDLNGYATFDYSKFKEDLQKLVIEDGSYTTNEETNAKKESEYIYNKVADAILSATDTEKLTAGKLGAQDVLNFVYYAVDAEGNVFFTSDMNVSTITSAKSSHVIKLGEIDVDDKNDDAFLKLVKANLADGDLADYVYSMVDASDKVIEDGNVAFITYEVSYQETDENGKTATVTKTAKYEKVTVDKNDEFLSKLIGTKIGETVSVKADDDPTSKSFETSDGKTYSNVKAYWVVEKEGQAIASFKYTPYTTSKEITPDGLYTKNAKGKDLKDVELTYYVFPVNYISIPAEDVSATVLLEKVYGKNLSADSFDVFGEAYVYIADGENAKIADLVASVAKIFDTTTKDKDFYADGSDLAKALKEYEDAKTAGGDDPDDAAKALIDEKNEALTKLQNAELSKVVAKIVAAKKGDTLAGDAIVEEYKKDVKHTLKEEYDSDITKKVQAAIWKLIDESVTVKGYPVDLVAEYADHLYESYEYKYHKGESTDSSSTSSTTNTKKPYETYDSVEAYIIASLKLGASDDVRVALETEAKAYIEPIIKLYVVAKACAPDAVKAFAGEDGYIRRDVKSGVYTIDEHAYEETYGDKAADKIADARENIDKTIAFNEANADKFIIDDDFMKAYKKHNGKTYYNQIIDQNGEINVRASLQFERLFYYLASQNVHLNEDDGHAHTEVDYVEIDGVKYLDFRTVKYTFASDEDAAE